MQINIDLSEHDLRKLVMHHLQHKLGDVDLKESDISIQVKSKQNFKSEWESASFRAKVDKVFV